MKSRSSIYSALMTVGLLAWVLGSGPFAPNANAKPKAAAKAKGKAGAKGVSVKLETSMGTIVIELNPEKAPKSVANFLSYVKDGHYNGTVFHRVIPNFMIQGGGFDAAMKEKPTRAPIPNEADNGLTNERGTLAMARTGDPNSATAQFFINVQDNPFLNFKSKDVAGWGYAVFGKVTQGMDVVDKIKVVSTTDKGPFQNVPVKPVVIKKATVL